MIQTAPQTLSPTWNLIPRHPMYLMAMVSVDKKSGKLTNVMMYGTGDGSSDSGGNLMTVAIAAFTSAFP